MRLVLVSRRFWPLMGGAEAAVANLAAEFRRQGARPTVVTARWNPRWPAEIVHRGAPVVRLPNPATRFWGTLRYMAALRRYLRERQGEIDAVYVSMLKHDAYVALGALRGTGVPVVLRAEGSGATGDFHWQQTANFGRIIRRRCRHADAFVAISRAIREDFLAAGFPAERIYEIPNGVSIPPPRTSARRLAARTALAEANPELQLDAAAPLVVYTGRLHEGKGLYDLLEAWKMVVPSHPQGRLWLVGEGPQGAALCEAIGARGLAASIRLPGAFDTVEDVLEAADVFVLPSYAEGMSNSLLEAMAAGLPVIASDIPANAAVVEHERHGLLVPPRDPPRLAAALRRIVERPDAAAAQFGAAARRRVEEEFSLERVARRHLELFTEAIPRRRSRCGVNA